MTAPRYVHVLQDHLLPSIEHLFLRNPRNAIFLQDNTPAHTAIITRNWLINHRVRTIEWPACSLDLNAIENLWAILKETVRQHLILNRADLVTAVNQIWQNDVEIQRTCQILSDSMVRRVQECVRNHGGAINY